jgi:hypothetical protein
MNTAKVIFAHVFRCNIVRDVLKKITPFVMFTSSPKKDSKGRKGQTTILKDL